MIDDKPAIAVLGPSVEPNTDNVVATLASALATGGYTVIVAGVGYTATVAARAAVAQGGGCSAVVSVQRACNPTEMAAAGHAPRAPTRAQPGAERSGLD